MRLAGAMVALLAAVSLAGAQEIRYEFESVDVEYAATFTAVPMESNATDWATRLAGGPGLPVKVTFGIVNLTWEDGSWAGEGFLKVQGAGGSMRFLQNSARTLFDGNSTDVAGLASFFWSAKQIEDGAVVKNFTPPIYAGSVVRWFEDGELVGIGFATSDHGEAAGQAFWHDPTPGNEWRVLLEDLHDTGDRRAG